MNSETDHTDKGWNTLVNRQFNDFDEFSESIHGWGVDFHQLESGRSQTELIQFGSPRLMVARFQMDKPFCQKGSTPPGMLSLGLIEPGAGKVLTTEGTLTDNEMWCFSADREFACTSQSDFRAYGLSIQESFLDEVMDLCELSNAQSPVGSNQVVRSRQRIDLDLLRNHLIMISHNIRNGEAALNSQQQTHELELDLTRQVLQVLSGPQEAIKPSMTSRRQLVLKRTLEYLDANPHTPVTVYELAQAVGSGIRTLEYVFKDYFGVSPKTYLVSRRLIGAHRELNRSEAKSERISDIANRWGFWHLGRFSDTYKQFFGELPSETLRAM